jgi:hypothetical protein
MVFEINIEQAMRVTGTSIQAILSLSTMMLIGLVIQLPKSVASCSAKRRRLVSKIRFTTELRNQYN